MYDHIHKPFYVFPYREIKFFIADFDFAKLLQRKDTLILNLTSVPNRSNISDIPQLKDTLKYNYDEMVMGWEDGSIPPVKNDFWINFLSYVESKGYKNVCIHCLKGHGRAGTALATLLVLVEKLSAEEAIRIIRKMYCQRAVETEGQVHYVHLMDYHYNGRHIPIEIPIHGSCTYLDNLILSRE